MPFDFAQVKAQARQTVHETLGVQAFYKDTPTSTPVEIRARWHNKIDRFGDLENAGYAELIQGIDRVVFQATVARANNMKRGGTVRFPGYGDIEFVLQTMDPSTGPYEEVWGVTRKDE